MIKLKGLKFILTSFACPEQYDVFKNDKQVAYVRLRWGHLSVTYPDVKGEKIFEHYFPDDFKGAFESEEERMEFLNKIADKINERIYKEEKIRR